MPITNYNRIYQAPDVAVDNLWSDHVALLDKSGAASARRVTVRKMMGDVVFANAMGLSTSGTASANSTALQNAIDEAANTNGTVLIGPGTYKIVANSITLPDPNSGDNNIIPWFVGSGNHVTVLKIESPDTGNLLTVEGNWRIGKLTLQGYETYDSNVCAGTGVFVRQMYEGAGFSDCRFNILQYGILGDTYGAYGSGSAMQGTITERCYFGGISHAGVWLANVANANHFRDCVFANGFPGNVGSHYGYGIRMGAATSNIVIDGCQFLTHKTGIRIAGTAGARIRNSYFESTSASSGPYIVADGVDSLNPYQTLTNGAASAEQKVVVVDSTTSLYAGLYVAYTLAGGAIERNRIATVDSATQITLTTNIGSGGIPNDTVLMGIEFVTSLKVDGCVNSFYYSGSGSPSHVFLQLRDARNVSLMDHWSTAYGKGLVDCTDDSGSAINTVTGLVMINNRNDHANTKMFVDDVVPNGALTMRQDISDVDSGGLAQTWIGKTIKATPDQNGDESFTFYADETLSLYVSSSYIDAPNGMMIGTGTEIVKHLSTDAAIDFGSVSANSTLDSSEITLTGVTTSCTVCVSSVGTPEAGLSFSAFVSQVNKVVVRCTNATTDAINPGARTFRIDAWQH